MMCHHKASRCTVVAVGSRIGFTGNGHTCIKCTVSSTADGNIIRNGEVRILIINWFEGRGVRGFTTLGIGHLDGHGVFVTAVVSTCHSHCRAGSIRIRGIKAPCIGAIILGVVAARNGYVHRICGLVRTSGSRHRKGSHHRIRLIHRKRGRHRRFQCVGNRQTVIARFQVGQLERRVGVTSEVDRSRKIV